MIGSVAHRFLRRHVRVMGSVMAVDTAEPLVVMTYDDGPEPGHTEGVLLALDEAGATATFFMLSRRARTHHALVREIVGRGHEVALHGHDHRPLNDFRPTEVRERTVAARAELEDAAGVEVRWMRPPYGRQSLRTYLAVRETGLMPVLWGATSRDSAPGEEDSRVASALRATRGTVLLCHDGRAGTADGVDDGHLAEFDRGRLTRRILEGYRERGLRGVSLAEALRHGRPRLGAWFA